MIFTMLTMYIYIYLIKPLFTTTNPQCLLEFFTDQRSTCLAVPSPGAVRTLVHVPQVP
jgi:hypothetical protein